MTWYKLVSEHREEIIANKVETCKFVRLGYVVFRLRLSWRLIQ